MQAYTTCLVDMMSEPDYATVVNLAKMRLKVYQHRYWNRDNVQADAEWAATRYIVRNVAHWHIPIYGRTRVKKCTR